MPASQGTNSTALDRAAADQHVDQWLQKFFPASEDQWQRSEIRELASELAGQAVNESLRRGEPLDALDEKLVWLGRFLSNLRFLGHSEHVGDVLRKGSADRSTSEDDIARKFEGVVWRRYNPMRSFLLGGRSTDYYDVSKDSILHVAAEYLAETWAQHGRIDWILLDMLVTREICVYGDEIKLNGAAFGWSDNGAALDLYLKHDGNFEKMQSDVTSRLFNFVLVLVFGWVAPIAVISAAFYYEFQAVGLLLGGLFGLSVAWWLLMLVVRGVRAAWRRSSDHSKPQNGALALLAEMQTAWQTLEGPVLNPIVVRYALTRARDRGAVWDGACWAIIERVIAKDPAVWITTTKAKAV